MTGLLYIGQVCTKPTVRLAMRLAAKLAVGCIFRAVGVINHAKVLWAVFIIFIVWFKEFFVLYHLAYTLIQYRP